MYELCFKLCLLRLLLIDFSLTLMVFYFPSVGVELALFVEFHNPRLIGLVLLKKRIDGFQKRQDMTVLLTGLLIYRLKGLINLVRVADNLQDPRPDNRLKIVLIESWHRTVIDTFDVTVAAVARMAATGFTAAVGEPAYPAMEHAGEKVIELL